MTRRERDDIAVAIDDRSSLTWPIGGGVSDFGSGK
jgi:hypothetical protein